MKILLLGSEGSMGRRYCACLKYLNYKFDTYDRRVNFSQPNFTPYTHFMICTPTETHFDYLKELIPMQKHILCEKPLSKDIEELNTVKDLLVNSGSTLTMMLQYSELLSPYTTGNSHYDFYRTGNDGLFWDCLQIIHLSQKTPRLNNTSPIWKCQINGHELKSNLMDAAYVTFIDKWLNNKITQNLGDIIETHKKVKELQSESDNASKSRNSNSSQK